MGANVSADRREIISTVTNSLDNNCSGSSNVAQTIKDSSVTLRGNAKCDTVTFKNTGSISQTCDMESISNAIADLAADIKDEQTAEAFGLNVSMDQSTYASQAANLIKQKCSNFSDVQQEIANINVILEDEASCDALEFMNNASVEQTCVMKTVMDGLAKLDVVEETGQESGINPLLLGAGIAIVVILILVGVFIYYRMKSGGGQQMGPYDYPQQKKSKAPLIIGIMLILTILIVGSILVWYFFIREDDEDEDE